MLMHRRTLSADAVGLSNKNKQDQRQQQAQPSEALDRFVREEWSKLGLNIHSNTSSNSNSNKNNNAAVFKKAQTRSKEDLLDNKRRPPRQERTDSFNMDSNDFDNLERPVNLARSFSDPERPMNNGLLDSPTTMMGHYNLESDSPSQRSRIISHTSSLTVSPGDPVSEQLTNYLPRPTRSRQDSRGSSYQGGFGEEQSPYDDFHYTFDAPSRGKLGIIIESSKDFGPTIHTVKDYSPLFGMVQPGDKIVFVENYPTSHMGTGQITQLLARTREDKEDGVISITVATPVEKIGIQCDVQTVKVAHSNSKQRGHNQGLHRQGSSGGQHGGHRGPFGSFNKSDSLKYSAGMGSSSSSSSDFEFGSFPSGFDNDNEDGAEGGDGSEGSRAGTVDGDGSSTNNSEKTSPSKEGDNSTGLRSPHDDDDETAEAEFHMLGGLSNEDINESDYGEDEDFY
jgi:hypothetical protein